MEEYNISAICWDLRRVSSRVMARVLYSAMHPGLAFLLKGLSILAFCSWVQNGRCPGKDLGIIWPTVHHSQSSNPSGSTHFAFTYSHLWFCRGFPGGSLYVVWGSQDHGLPSPNLLPTAAWPVFGNVCFQEADAHFSFASASTQSMWIIGKRGTASAYKYIQKPFERHINPCISSTS
jgi:hypothetical protein